MTRNSQHTVHAVQSRKSPKADAARPALGGKDTQPSLGEWIHRTATNADGFLPATSVLVVERAPDALEQVRKAFCGQATHVQVATTQAAFAQMLAWQRFDLVLIATNLHNMSPLKLVASVRESAGCRDAMVILMATGWNDAAAGAKPPQHDLVLSKPLDPGLLQACLGCVRPAAATAEIPAFRRRLSLPASRRKKRLDDQVTGHGRDGWTLAGPAASAPAAGLQGQ